MAFVSFLSWGGWGSPLLTVSTMSVSGTSDLKDRAMGALSGGRETMDLVCLQERWVGKEPQTRSFFSRGLKRHVTDCKEAAVTHLLHLGKSGEGKGDWQQGSREGRECET